MKSLYILSLLTSLCLLTGCLAARINGGKVIHGQTVLQQSQDPKSSSSLNQESERTETLLLPAHSVVTIGTNAFTTSSNAVYTITTKDKVASVLGSAQKNTLADTAAKLASLSWLTWLGAILVIFGGASAVWPPLKALVNSLTTSLICILTGIGFIALPVLLVGHEVLILCIGLGAVALYWFAHHHGSISSELKVLKGKE